MPIQEQFYIVQRYALARYIENMCGRMGSKSLNSRDDALECSPIITALVNNAYLFEDLFQQFTIDADETSQFIVGMTTAAANQAVAKRLSEHFEPGLRGWDRIFDGDEDLLFLCAERKYEDHCSAASQHRLPASDFCLSDVTAPLILAGIDDFLREPQKWIVGELSNFPIMDGLGDGSVDSPITDGIRRGFQRINGQMLTDAGVVFSGPSEGIGAGVNSYNCTHAERQQLERDIGEWSARVNRGLEEGAGACPYYPGYINAMKSVVAFLNKCPIEDPNGEARRQIGDAIASVETIKNGKCYYE